MKTTDLITAHRLERFYCPGCVFDDRDDELALTMMKIIFMRRFVHDHNGTIPADKYDLIMAMPPELQRQAIALFRVRNVPDDALRNERIMLVAKYSKIIAAHDWKNVMHAFKVIRASPDIRYRLKRVMVARVNRTIKATVPTVTTVTTASVPTEVAV